MSNETTYFLLGIAISIPIAVLAPFATSRIQKNWAKRNASQARRRKEILRSEYSKVERYHSDPSGFTQYLIIRLIVLNIIWVADGIVGDMFGLTSNAFTTISSFAEGTSIDLNKYANLINSISSVVSVFVLAITLRVGLRAYRLWQRVNAYEAYKREVEAEVQSLDAVTSDGSKPVPEGTKTGSSASTT